MVIGFFPVPKIGAQVVKQISKPKQTFLKVEQKLLGSPGDKTIFEDGF